MAEIAARRAAIASEGTQLAFVHMARDEQIEPLLGSYGLQDVPRVSDPDALLYRAFGLTRGTFAQLMGWRVLKRGLQSFLSGFRPGMPLGNVSRLPGVFLIHEGRILRTFRHETIADRPDYENMACPIG